MEPYTDLNSAAHYANEAAHEFGLLRDRANTGSEPLNTTGLQAIMGKVVTALDATGQREALIESLETHLEILRRAHPAQPWHEAPDLPA